MNNSDSVGNYKLQLEIRDLPAPVYAIDTSPAQKQFSFGLANGQMYACNYDFDAKNPEFEPYQYQFAKAAQEHVEIEKEKEKERKKKALKIRNTTMMNPNLVKKEKSSPRMKESR